MTAGSNFTAEAQFGLDWLQKMWDDSSQTLYYQVAVASGGNRYNGDHDIWRLPQVDDHYMGCSSPYEYICHRPVFQNTAGGPGAAVSPNLAGRLAADFALCYKVFLATDRAYADNCLLSAEHVFELADTASKGNLLTTGPYDFYPENEWRDDMELGATELYFALQGATDLPRNLAHTNPRYYLSAAAKWANAYITGPNDAADTLNLYDVSGLAHFELYRALAMAGDPGGLAISQAGIREQLLRQVSDAITQASLDAWGFGYVWSYGDTTSHGAGISVMASEANYLTRSSDYDIYSQRWLANILGANAWGSSFIVGDGSTFPNCIQHQVANLAGALDGTSGGTPILWGAASEGPSSYASSGVLDGMILCPANGVDTFRKFNGNDGAYNASQAAVYRDNVQSYSTTEPGIDLTATSFLMWSWRLAGHPEF